MEKPSGKEAWNGALASTEAKNVQTIIVKTEGEPNVGTLAAGLFGRDKK